MGKNPKAQAVMDQLIEDVKNDPSLLLKNQNPLRLEDIRAFVDDTAVLDGSRSVFLINGRLSIGPLLGKKK